MISRDAEGVEAETFQQRGQPLSRRERRVPTCPPGFTPRNMPGAAQSWPLPSRAPQLQASALKSVISLQVLLLSRRLISKARANCFNFHQPFNSVASGNFCPSKSSNLQQINRVFSPVPGLRVSDKDHAGCDIEVYAGSSCTPLH